MKVIASGALALFVSMGAAAAQNAVNPAAPSTHNPATKPIDETFQEPIPPAESTPNPLDWGGLRPDYGREETYYFCSPCHSIPRIKQTRRSRAEWDATIDRILAEHPYEPLDPEEREIILDYLAKQYGPNVP
jgi:hypothetical protein